MILIFFYLNGPQAQSERARGPFPKEKKKLGARGAQRPRSWEREGRSTLVAGSSRGAAPSGIWRGGELEGRGTVGPPLDKFA